MSKTRTRVLALSPTLTLTLILALTLNQMRIGTPGLWTIRVKVTDAYGAEGVASAGPLTIEPTVLDSSEATAMLGDADTLAKGGSS